MTSRATMGMTHDLHGDDEEDLGKRRQGGSTTWKAMTRRTYDLQSDNETHAQCPPPLSVSLSPPATSVKIGGDLPGAPRGTSASILVLR